MKNKNLKSKSKWGWMGLAFSFKLALFPSHQISCYMILLSSLLLDSEGANILNDLEPPENIKAYILPEWHIRSLTWPLLVKSVCPWGKLPIRRDWDVIQIIQALTGLRECFVCTQFPSWDRICNWAESELKLSWNHMRGYWQVEKKEMDGERVFVSWSEWLSITLGLLWYSA